MVELGVELGDEAVAELAEVDGAALPAVLVVGVAFDPLPDTQPASAVVAMSAAEVIRSRRAVGRGEVRKDTELLRHGMGTNRPAVSLSADEDVVGPVQVVLAQAQEPTAVRAGVRG